MTRRHTGYAAAAFALAVLLCAPAAVRAGCVEGVGPNNERMPCRPDDWRPNRTIIHVPTPRDHANTLMNQARFFWDKDDWAKVVELYRRALAYDPTYPAALNNLTSAYINWGNALRRSDNPSRAEWAYRQAVGVGGSRSGTADAYAGLGDVNTDWRRYGEAERYYRKALAIDPDNRRAFSNLSGLRDWQARKARVEARNRLAKDALAAFKSGDYDAAIAAFRQLIAVEPKNVWARNMLGNAYLQADRFDAAMAAFREALRWAEGGDRRAIKENIAIAEKRKASAIRKRDFARAEAKTGAARVTALRDLISRYPYRKGQLTLLIAETRRDMGDMEGYRQVLKDYVAAGNDGSRAFREARSRLNTYYVDKVNRAIKAEDAGAQIAAIRELRKVRKPEPIFDRVEARALVDLDRYRDAIALLREAVKRFPDDARTNYDLGWQLYLHGDVKEAKAFMERTLAIDPSAEAAREVLDRIASYDGSIRQFVNERILGLHIGEHIHTKVADKIRGWFGKDAATPAPAQKAAQTAHASAKPVPGAFGAAEPPVPVVGAIDDPSRFSRLKDKAFAAAPEPVVRMTKSSVSAAIEVWQRAGVEGKAFVRDTGLDWIAAKLPKVRTLKSLTEKTASLYGDFSTPINAYYAHAVAGVEGAVRTQTGEGSLDEKAFAQASRDRAKAIDKMTDDVTRKVMEWRGSGGTLPNGADAKEEMIHLGDRLTGYVEKVFRLDRLWPFNRDEEVDKWAAAQASH